MLSPSVGERKSEVPVTHSPPAFTKALPAPRSFWAEGSQEASAGGGSKAGKAVGQSDAGLPAATCGSSERWLWG